MKKSCEVLLGELLPYFPKPPASVLCIAREVCCCIDELSEHGYEVTPLAFQKRGAWEIPVQVYDIIIVYYALSSLEPMKGFLVDVRQLLAKSGALVICDELSVLKCRRNRTGFYSRKEMVTDFYENGFSIRVCKKWPGPVDDAIISPKPCVNNGDCEPGLSSPSGSFAASHGQRVDGAGLQPHMILGRKDDVFLRSYQEGDEETILPMFKEVFNTERSMAHWYWKFRDNPFGAYKIAQAFSKEGALAGHYSGYPLPFYASAGEDEQFLSFQIGDIMTRPGFRRLGLGKTSVLGRITDYFHHKFCVDHIPFLYGFVAGNHRKFGERFLRYQYMYDIPFYVLDLNGATLKSDGWTKRMASGIRVAEVYEVGPAFDRLFEKAAKNYGLLVKRDAKYLKWRYLDCPDGEHRIFALKRFGKVVGWSVFRIRGTVLIWGDALFQKPYAVFAKRLILQILKQQFRTVRRIEGWFSKNPAWWENVLEDMGFTVTKEPNGLVAGVTIFESSLSVASIEENLYYTMGDSDLF